MTEPLPQPDAKPGPDVEEGATPERPTTKTETETERPTIKIARPGIFITVVIASCFAMGLAIYWLLRSMHI